MSLRTLLGFCALSVGLVVGLLVSLPLSAETVQWRGYEIHYTTFNSLLIPQEVAQAHNIVRSKYRIVTNVSILKEGDPSPATVTGFNSNLLNQLFQMEFDEVTEKSAIYYLSNQLIDERDSLRFTITVQPFAEDEAYELKFMRQY
ncbi:MAG: hypothetical protein ACJAX5_003164 [Patiriisocius sp.]|jgi:hypothetical protein